MTVRQKIVQARLDGSRAVLRSLLERDAPANVIRTEEKVRGREIARLERALERMRAPADTIPDPPTLPGVDMAPQHNGNK